MRRNDLIRDRLSHDVQISSGFGSGFSLQHGLVIGPYDMAVNTDEGAVGTIVPVSGDRHIKVLLGSE